MATLIDSLSNLVAPATGQIAGRLGESEAAVSRGMTGTLGSVLGGLVHSTRDTAAFDQIFDVMSSPPPSANLAGDVETAVGTLDATAGGATNTATKFLGMLFGGQTNAVADLIGRTAGFTNPASAMSLLSFAVPTVINFFGRKIRDDGLDAGGLRHLLTNERESILAAAPPGFMNVLEGVPQTPPVEEREVLRTAIPADRPYVGDTRHERSGRWLWPAVGVAAALLAWIAVSQARTHRVTHTVRTGVSAMDTMANRTGAPAATGTAGGEVGPAIGGLGALAQRRLPNGIVIDVPAYGTESRVLAYIEGPQTASELATFDFDRLSFSPRSAQILPESREQLNNIALVMRAYPEMTVKIAGNYENVGAPVTNLKLSQQRANAVKQALERSGIAANRVTTEAGGPRNLRATLEVTHK